MPYLRTPQELTVDQQEKFYAGLMDRSCPHRYFAFGIDEFPALVGVGGLTHIQWENGITEISLITDPKMAGRGYGREIVSRLLCVAFDQLRMKTLIAECYNHNPALAFWHKMAEEFHALPPVTMPRRKFWYGKLIDATLFTWTDEAWRG